MDNNIAHWDKTNKVPGLFRSYDESPGTPGDRNMVRHLLMHWQGTGDSYELSTVVNINQLLHDYYVTGNRRSADILKNFSDAAKNTLTYDKIHWRAILAMMHLAQAYEFTWEPRLRELVYEINNRYMYDPEGMVLLTKRRPYRSTTYKTPTDQDAILVLWQIFRESLFKKMAMTVGKNNMEKEFIHPLGGRDYRSPGFVFHFLWEETKNPSIISDFTYAIKSLVGFMLVDPETKKVRVIGTHTVPKYLKGLPLSMDILTRTGADKKTFTSWLAFRVTEAPIQVFFTKPGEQVMGHNLPVKEVETSMEILVRKELGIPLKTATKEQASVPKPARAGGNVVIKPHVVLGTHLWAGHDLNRVTERSGVSKVVIPKDAPGGIYELSINQPGEYSIITDKYTPLVLYAPLGWTPPRMIPPIKIYFRVTKENKDSRIFFGKGARLFMPNGEAFREGEVLKGWVNLPEEIEGLWSFEGIEPGLIKTENLPGFFAFCDSNFYMEHK